MQNFTLYGITAAIFLILDAIMLNTVMAPLFRQYLGEALLATPRLGPAALFYLFYVLGLIILVSHPAEGDVMKALWQGALVGAIAYGTYEMTNYATLSQWHLRMVVTDGLWGTVLTGVSAAGGVWATKAIFG